MTDLSKYGVDRRTFFITLLVSLHAARVAAAQHIRVSFVRPARFASNRETLTLIVQIDTHPDNRTLTAAVIPQDGSIDDALRTTEIDLVTNNYRTHRIEPWGPFEAGDYYFYAHVTDNFGNIVGTQKSSLQIIGMDG